MKQPRETLHLIRLEGSAAAPATVHQLEHESDWQFKKRTASIRALGPRWLRHPAYRFSPLHSVNPEVWQPAHRAFWETVHAVAAADRARNQAFIRAQRVVVAVGGQQ
jgi:hypothetical protein